MDIKEVKARLKEKKPVYAKSVVGDVWKVTKCVNRYSALEPINNTAYYFRKFGLRDEPFEVTTKYLFGGIFKIYKSLPR